MEVTVPSRLRAGPIAGRVASLAGGAGLAVLGLYVAANDPAAPGAHFPACQFRAATGLWCPGCGLTRGCHQLLTGHPLAALGENLFVPLFLVVVAVAWANWVRTSFGRRSLRVPRRLQHWAAVGLPILLVAYGVLRNIPAAPFRALAP
jgi:hypothetical protein